MSFMQCLKKKEEELVDGGYEKQISIHVLEEPILVESEDSRMLKEEGRRKRVEAR